MHPRLPVRNQHYNGPISDASRWDRFVHRPGDIVVSAPAKSGMTWMQTILAMLIFGRADIEVQPAKISPWLDARLTPVSDMLEMLDAQKHRRYLKTHTPLDGIPYFVDCTYIAVYRDPVDALFSLVGLAETTADAKARARMPVDIHASFREWLGAPFEPGQSEQPALAATAHHLMSFWDYRSLPNIHLFHYADMTRDLARSIQAVGNAIGISVDDGTAAAMAKTASFANMRAKARQFAPTLGRDAKADDNFFRTGRSQQWREVLDAGEVALYRQRLSSLLLPGAAAWLEKGSSDGLSHSWP